MAADPEDRPVDRRLRRLRIWFSVIPIVLGVLMVALIGTPVGPSPLLGFTFGTVLVVYGAARLYLTLRR